MSDSGFACPNCKTGRMVVLDSRQIEGGMRRRRGCPECQHRISTYEAPEGDNTAVKMEARRMIYKLLEQVKV